MLNQEVLHDLYCKKQLSIGQIAKLHGLAKSNIRRQLIRAEIQLRDRVEGIKLAGYRCAAHLKGSKLNYSIDRINKTAEARRKQAAESAAGHSVNSKGYLTFTVGPHKHRHVHTVLAEMHLLGRRLRSDEVVHHKDGNKLNNDIANLEVMTRAAHTAHHRKETANAQ